ncbi:GNAT family N-acetyltransferase [Eikenella sp. S3360]|uniref:GNAT family N-acetyltransferase n=1 Tax=Eikenella glucosivorans TaxID=2766967 RepID=A0ABS0NBI5_9NEIS|nr:GNAT family protein [Eikenella glucosivorans]MBH5329635.1 GNAT family N-acetyltransferase [Eikenella glucosivorans]
MAAVNPYNGLISFQQALDQKLIQPRKLSEEKNYYIELDKPNGVVRLTYALITYSSILNQKKEVRAICQIVPVESYNNRPVMQVGCAVLEKYQNKGIGQLFIRDCLKIFSTEFLSQNLVEDGFYFEAIIDKRNIPSQRLFEKLGFLMKEETVEEDFQYFKFVDR